MDGTLGVNPADLATLDSAEAANGITALPGASGTIDVTCNNPAATINIDSVVESNTASAIVNTLTTKVKNLVDTA